MASFDLVTAAAVIGAIDLVQDQDTVLPELDLSQPIPRIAAVDLTNIDFAELMAITIAPAARRAEIPDIDLDQIDLEQLLAHRIDGADEARTGIHRIAMDELLRVEVEADGQDDIALPFDLTGLDLEFLQDIRFGDDMAPPRAPFRHVAALELADILPKSAADDGDLLTRAIDSLSSESGGYQPIQQVAASMGIAAGGSLPLQDAVQAPTALADAFDTTQDIAIAGNVLANDTAPNGGPLAVTNAGKLEIPNGGTVVIDADGAFTYTPPAGFSGIDSFDYTVTDTNGATATATATIEVAPVNGAPVATDDSFAGAEDTVVAGNILTNDSDPDGDVLTVASAGTLATAAGGIVVIAADGSFTFSPAADHNGLDSFAYTVSDGNGGTAAAKVEIDVAAVNDAPTGIDDVFYGAEDTVVVGNVLANDSDTDGDTLTVANAGTLTTAEAGTVTLGADGSFTYLPAANFNGTDSFAYAMADGNGATADATARIEVGAVNDAPVAEDDAFIGAEDTILTGTVLANDHDPDGDTLTVASTGALATSAGGTAVIEADGRFAYRPPAGFNGTDSFIYIIEDGRGGTSNATATIEVGAANVPPVAADDNYVFAMDTAMLANVLENDRDPDGDMLSVSNAGVLSTAQGGMVKLEFDGNFTYKPLDGFIGTDGFSYSVEDGRGGVASAVVTFTLVAPGGVLDGSAGNDRLVGTPGADVLDGRAGDDLLIGLAGPDVLEGGTGIDTVSYRDSGAGVKVSLFGGEGLGGDAEGDVLSGIENLKGTAFDDYLSGDAGDNVIWGGPGNDEIFGHVGHDVLIGGPGANWLDGGDGIDRVEYRNSDAGVLVDLYKGNGSGGHADGDILEKIEDIAGSRFDDVLIGDKSANSLHGGRGSDTLFGGAGDDVLNGGPGNDILIGDAGSETFLFGAGSGTDRDTIGDFISLEDVIDLSALGLSGMSDLTIQNDGAGGSLINLPSGDSIAVLLVDPASLSPTDFIF